MGDWGKGEYYCKVFVSFFFTRYPRVYIMYVSCSSGSRSACVCLFWPTKTCSSYIINSGEDREKEIKQGKSKSVPGKAALNKRRSM